MANENKKRKTKRYTIEIIKESDNDRGIVVSVHLKEKHILTVLRWCTVDGYIDLDGMIRKKVKRSVAEVINVNSKFTAGLFTDAALNDGKISFSVSTVNEVYELRDTLLSALRSILDVYYKSQFNRLTAEIEVKRDEQ